MNSELIALLGQRDSPTDGVEDYCTYLGQVLAKWGVELRLVRMPWAEIGWPRALRWLWRESAQWKSHYVLVQYTALKWSRRGFPFRLLPALLVLKRRGLLIAIVFHDVAGYPGHRPVDRMRRFSQHLVMRLAYRWTNRSILTVPLDEVPWLPSRGKAVFIPVGANLLEPPITEPWGDEANRVKTVAVYGVTGGTRTEPEVFDIAYAVKRAAKALVPSGQALRLVVLGRGSEEAEPVIRYHLNKSEVEVSILGILPAQQVAEVLVQSDVLLFVRGHISSRRGSALAGIACGLPMVAYKGEETRFPITEAGILTVPQGDQEGIGNALAEVLTDDALWAELHARSIAAQRRYFSWDVIAQRLLGALCHE